MASKLKTSLAMGVIAVIALIIIAIVGLPRLTGRRAETDKGTDMSKKDEPQFKYGFRYDPMKWLAGDESLQAARIRTFLFAGISRMNSGLRPSQTFLTMLP